MRGGGDVVGTQDTSQEHLLSILNKVKAGIISNRGEKYNVDTIESFFYYMNWAHLLQKFHSETSSPEGKQGYKVNGSGDGIGKSSFRFHTYIPDDDFNPDKLEKRTMEGLNLIDNYNHWENVGSNLKYIPCLNETDYGNLLKVFVNKLKGNKSRSNFDYLQVTKRTAIFLHDHLSNDGDDLFGILYACLSGIYNKIFIINVLTDSKYIPLADHITEFLKGLEIVDTDITLEELDIKTLTVNKDKLEQSVITEVIDLFVIGPLEDSNTEVVEMLSKLTFKEGSRFIMQGMTPEKPEKTVEEILNKHLQFLKNPESVDLIESLKGFIVDGNAHGFGYSSNLRGGAKPYHISGCEGGGRTFDKEKGTKTPEVADSDLGNLNARPPREKKKLDEQNWMIYVDPDLSEDTYRKIEDFGKVANNFNKLANAFNGEKYSYPQKEGSPIEDPILGISCVARPKDLERDFNLKQELADKDSIIKTLLEKTRYIKKDKEGNLGYAKPKQNPDNNHNHALIDLLCVMSVVKMTSKNVSFLETPEGQRLIDDFHKPTPLPLRPDSAPAPPPNIG